jgi:IclR family acetate operon transcriptional repressor
LFCVIRKTADRVESVHRALVLLKALIAEGSIGVTEAAVMLDVNASTAQRLLATLVQDGFASQGRDRRYGVGPALHAPGLTTNIPRLTDQLRPALEALYERGGETVHLAALVGTRILHLDGIEARSQVLRFGLRVGVWLPAHFTASGRVLLADLADEEVAARYGTASSGGRKPLDVEIDVLLSQLQRIRESRIAWNIEESEPGVVALAISVGEIGGQRVAMSFALPAARFTQESAEKLAQDLIDIADAVAGRSSGAAAL